MKILIVMALSICIMLIVPHTGHTQQWSSVAYLPGEQTIRLLCADKFDRELILAASNSTVYHLNNEQNRWEKLFDTTQEEIIIRFIVLDPLHNKTLYIGTSNAVFKSTDNGRQWKKIYGSFFNLNEEVYQLEINPHNRRSLLLRTNKGVYESRDGGKKWTSLIKNSDTRNINFAAYHPYDNSTLFVVINNILYKTTRNGTMASEMMSFRHVNDEDLPDNDFRTILLACSGTTLFVAHGKELFKSLDDGKTWAPLSQLNSYLRKSICDLGFIEDSETIVICTNNTIIVYDIKSNQISGISDGLPSTRLNALKLFSDGTIYVASAQGIFSRELHETTSMEGLNEQYVITSGAVTEMKLIFESEPSILELQRAAIAYAGVSNEMVEKWHRNSRARALLPSFSFNLQTDKENNIELDRGSTSTPDTFINGPEIINTNWEVGMEWDLADLIWNSDQTTIDYRKKYIVELREDVLHRLTTLYFERRRLQTNLILHPPQDKNEYLQQCIKIDELTALIDSLTGGYFTDRMKTCA